VRKTLEALIEDVDGIPVSLADGVQADHRQDALTRATRRTQAMQLKMTVDAAKQRALELMYRGYH